MIPCAVELTDFLSHRSANGDPVVFDFEGAVLWSVAGDNGAGKSAIFDAIVWTLYGQHRGGTQDARRLISHGADMKSSMAFDLESGHPSEIDYINGAVAAAGRRSGVATPYNDAVIRLVKAKEALLAAARKK